MSDIVKEFGTNLESDKKSENGMYYTPVEYIHKMIDPLFLNDLKKRRDEVIASSPYDVIDFIEELSKMSFFDPSSGSGNILVEIYKSLREIEKSCIDVLRQGTAQHDGYRSQIKVSNFYGIELDEEAYEISRIIFKRAVEECDAAAGLPVQQISVDDFTGIHHGDAVETDWKSIVSPDELSFIVGNPPYLGAQYRSKEQKEQMTRVFKGIKGTGILDFAAIWIFKAFTFCKGKECKCAFILPEVSIFKSKAVPLLFERALAIKGVRCKVLFAYKPFRWRSEGFEAVVQVTAIGFDCNPHPGQKAIYFRDDDTSELVDNINFYLLKAPNIFVHPRETPLFEYIYIYIREINEKSVNSRGGRIKYSLFAQRLKFGDRL